MKVSNLIWGVFLLLVGCQATSQVNDYVVIAGKGVMDDADWNKVAESLKSKHQAVLISYQEGIDEVMPQLKKIKPRYVAVVEKPENLIRE